MRDADMDALALGCDGVTPQQPVTGRRSGCVCVTASGSLATVPSTVAAVRWNGPPHGTEAEYARLDVEELRPGFTLAAKRYAGHVSSAARVETKGAT